jgi:hypothetical protein
MLCNPSLKVPINPALRFAQFAHRMTPTEPVRIAARGRNQKPLKIGGSPRIAHLNSIAYKTDPPIFGGSEISATGR